MKREEYLKYATKHQRNADVIEYKKNNKWASCATIGKLFGISRQRVHQILKADD